MKKISLIIAIAIIAISCNKNQNPETSPSDDKSTLKKSGTVHQLRLLDNDLLVGEYDDGSGTITVTNLSGLIGTTFDDLAIPANTYTVTEVKISHEGFEHFYIEYTGTNATVGDIDVAIPLYVGPREQPDNNFKNCPKETHTCSGGSGSTKCSCCSFKRNPFTSCINGCICSQVPNPSPSPTTEQCRGVVSTCSHTVTTSQIYSQHLEDEADNAAS